MTESNASASNYSSHKKSGFHIKPLHYLLVVVPVAVVLRFVNPEGLWLFLASCVAIIPLAGLMGEATENLAETLGAGIGGLLNATFGNAAELIIALIALSYGKTDLVKASITGSILGNVLLVLGASIVAGGLFKKKQTFNRTAASMGATLLALASVGLLVPTLHYHLFYELPRTIRQETRQVLQNEKVIEAGAGKSPSEAEKKIDAEQDRQKQEVMYLSEEIAVILAIVYGLSLLFSLKTHQHLFGGPEEHTGSEQQPEWDRKTSVIVLLAATAAVAVMSEFLVGSVEHAARQLGMNDIFIGVVVVAVIGNAAEHSTALMVAIKDKMDLAVNIAVGSSIQVALFVAPVLVFASLLMGLSPPLDLHFSPMEIVAFIIAIAVVALVAQDGESHWMEGVMLLAVYIILALAFYYVPVPAGASGH